MKQHVLPRSAAGGFIIVRSLTEAFFGFGSQTYTTQLTPDGGATIYHGIAEDDAPWMAGGRRPIRVQDVWEEIVQLFNPLPHMHRQPLASGTPICVGPEVLAQLFALRVLTHDRLDDAFIAKVATDVFQIALHDPKLRGEIHIRFADMWRGHLLTGDHR